MTEHKLDFNRIIADSLSDKNLCVALDLLQEAFPPEERRTPERQLSALSHPDYRLCLVSDNGKNVGVVGYFVTPRFVYFENFCIDASLRNGGYGSDTLVELVRLYSNRLFVLEAELPSDALKQRRIDFYLRNGMVVNSYDHIQPHYNPWDADLHLVVLSYGRELSATEYADFKLYLDDNVDINGKYTK